MRKLFGLVLAFTMLGVLLPVPAQADGNFDIASCSTYNGICRENIYGVSAAIYIDDYNVESWGGRIVQSVYITRYDPDIFDISIYGNYIEFGWERARYGLTASEKVFVCWHANGAQTCNDYANPSARGTYWFTLFQSPGSLGTFRFSYKRPDGGFTTLSPVNPPGTWYKGYPVVTQEKEKPGDDMGVFDLDVSLLNSSLNPTGWFAAQTPFNMHVFRDTSPYDCALINDGGRDIVYYLEGGGNC